jgi:hypothetical protein
MKDCSVNNAIAFKPESISWFANKIKAGIAEATCRAHFEALGYAVESTGFESIVPQYCRLNKLSTGNYIDSIKQMQLRNGSPLRSSAMRHSNILSVTC